MKEREKQERLRRTKEVAVPTPRVAATARRSFPPGASAAAAAAAAAVSAGVLMPAPVPPPPPLPPPPFPLELPCWRWCPLPPPPLLLLAPPPQLGEHRSRPRPPGQRYHRPLPQAAPSAADEPPPEPNWSCVPPLLPPPLFSCCCSCPTPFPPSPTSALRYGRSRLCLPSLSTCFFKAARIPGFKICLGLSGTLRLAIYGVVGCFCFNESPAGQPW